ncbi:MAG: RHS repeat-associated core domain-containing protein, partial [Ignavibacteria bacterium]|nr:RHS repeat-associated core domain-containing protein [Ignavibacteria bacterium]
MGKTTSYLYDDHSNISQKTSPDEGTTKYRYDKYGNLRFSLNIGAPATEKALNFTKYDQFNRLIASGLLISTFGFDQLNADLDYSTNQGSITHFENFNTDTANFVVANMYDKYVKTGIFTNMPNPHLASFISGKNLKGKLVATAFRDKPGDPWSYKVYTYDYLGRVHYYWVKIGNKNWRVVINEYDNLGNTIKQNINNEFYVWYDYDEQGRLQEVRSSIHNTYTTAILDAVYTYDKSDKIKSSEFGTRVKPKMNYTYDAKGRVTDLNGIATDMFTTQFRETLTYFDNDNIESMYLQNTGNGSWSNLSFSYVYDGLNRLRNSNCNNASFSEAFNYNDDGNFTSKNKSGLTMSYNYVTNTNKINYVKFNTVDKYYSHDYRGNIVSDGNKGLSIINYDRRNLILSFIKSGQTNYYRYDDNGNRIYKGIYNQPKEYYFRDHTGKELGIYDLNTGRLKMLNLYGNGLMGKVNVRWDSTWTETDPGTWEYVYSRTDERQYYFKDHLGSIRMILDENSEIVGAQDYYPFGSLLREATTGGNINNKYKFTEKERDTETNYDYFGARYYDSDLARWLSVDPLADIYPGWSPY